MPFFSQFFLTSFQILFFYIEYKNENNCLRKQLTNTLQFQILENNNYWKSLFVDSLSTDPVCIRR